MKSEKWKRYLFAVTAVVLFAGVVWYFSNVPTGPSEGAVLAFKDQSGYLQMEYEKECQVQKDGQDVRAGEAGTFSEADI